MDINNLSVDHQNIVKAWTCAFTKKSVIYLSGPITTGVEYVDHILQHKDTSNLVTFNCAKMKYMAREFRKEHREPVLEPGSLHMPTWSQEDYLQIWTLFIETFATRVIFCPRWQYSVGCAQEFLCARRCGVQTSTFLGVELTVEYAIQLLQESTTELSKNLEEFPTLNKLHTGLCEVLQRAERDLNPQPSE